MSGMPTSQVPEPESPLAGSPPPRPPEDAPLLPAKHKRSSVKKILTPLVLAVLGLLLFLEGYSELSSDAARATA